VVPGFLAQTGINGNPLVTAAWQNARMKDEPVVQGNMRGFVSFAKPSRPDSRGTQFFINFADNSALLDALGFAAFGEVVSGMETVDNIYSGDLEKPEQIRINREGNDYLLKQFPNLDFIQKAIIGK
jgi:peptidyl-prolyl cis-trans isomerase A (cyclophilin A)